MFRSDMSLMIEKVGNGDLDKMPYLAVFKKSGKTLVYLAADHCTQKTFRMVDMAFQKFNPNIAVVEFEREGRRFEIKPGERMHESIYVAAIANSRAVPVVKADLSLEEMLQLLRKLNPDRSFEMDGLIEVLTRHDKPEPIKKELDKLARPLILNRNTLMAREITNALNAHGTTLAVFGEAHYRHQQKIFEDMLGPPEYIYSEHNLSTHVTPA